MTTARVRRAQRRAEARGDPFDPSRLATTGRTGRQTRESRAIALVTCPHCGAVVGAPCTPRSEGDHALQGTGRVWIHRDRRTAWQMARDGELPEET